ncbi:MAG: hypothetical protein LBF89_06435 [Bacteroidales bacterium]|jgi:hypothetical protein|nr:hypothetical protein [Bacteroidales bacterium]
MNKSLLIELFLFYARFPDREGINIRTFSLPDSLGIQYLLSETNIDLSMNDETKGHQETTEDSTSGSGSLNAGYESADETVEEVKEIDRRPFRIPVWVWWVAGAIGAGFIVFKAKDWLKWFG